MSTVKAKVPVFDTQSIESRDYWIQILSGVAGASGLRPDFERPAVDDGRLKTVELTIADEIQQKLSKLTKGSPFLSYTILLAVLNVCLHKYTGAETIVVGSPARRREDDDHVNALPIVSHIDRTAKFKDFLMNLRETLVEAYSHQNYPYKRLVRDLGLDEEENRCSLFDIALTFDEIHGELPDVHHDLTIVFQQTETGVAGFINYNGDLFTEWTIDRFAARFIHVLDEGLTNIETPTGALSILLDEERELILHEWNHIPESYPPQPCLHELFATQAAKTPDNLALIFEDQKLSYRELDQCANRLANYLIRNGLKPGERAGIMIQRSAEMLVGLLGILKAGGVYVPLDPGYPPDRLKFMIDDAAPQIVLTDIPAEAQTESDEAPAIEIDPNAPAYMIYTSGSTGQPKGVVVQHAGVSNLAYAQVIGFRVTAESRCLQFASFSFDTSISDIFTTFAAGAALCVANREQRVSVTALANFLRETEVTLVTLPPAILALLENDDLPALKTVITAGEACPANVMARWMEGREFFNAYGPTEASVCATYLECTETYQDGPPIGRPWPNMEAYILDESLQPAPVGLPGELYIGGIGLAHGYLNRPELTAQRFVPHPFSKMSGARLYATGDLARFRSDGQIEFLGRVDQQVKLRGFRIELGEVEAVLASHPHVREVAVLLREDKPGQKQLVAYLVGPGAELKTQGDELRQHLKHWLPEFMVPGQFIWLAEMPLTANGKIDRKQLPAPDETREGTAQEGYEGPQTTVEELLTQIWTEVLNVERVGRNDNFFELGGHSLLGTQLVSRIREAFEVEIELTGLFEAPTVAELAQLVEAELSEGQNNAGVPPLEKADRDAELPLSFAQQRLWFLAQLEPESAVYNISSALRLKGNLSVPVLEQTLSEIVRRHEAFRTTFARAADGRPVQVIAAPQPATITTSDLSEFTADAKDVEARRLAMEEAHRPFDLNRGPLVRTHLLRLSATEHVLLFTIHHIIGDGWSMGVLVREVAALYAAFSEGQSSPLAELSIQYADYAVWQRDWLQGETLDQQLSYWKKQLNDAPQQLELPTDHARPAVYTPRGARIIREFTPDLTTNLETQSRREGVTLFMYVLAAFQALLARYSGQNDISVGVPVANRRRAELEDLIGFFVNTLVMRTDVSGDPTFSELLQRVRKVALGAYAHQDVPFEKLVEELQPTRDLSRSPLFQVMLALQNAPASSLELPELELSGIGIIQQTAKFDLTLAIDRADDKLVASLEYNSNLFEETTIERMLNHFFLLLEKVIENPSQKLSALPVLTEAETQQVLVDWNATQGEYSPLLAHELFAEHARLRPDTPAIVFQGEHQLTYTELDQLATRCAQRLLNSGLEPEARVAVMLERSPEMIVSLLAIFKAGGVYLPLDPAYPSDRLAYMIEDARPHVVLTSRSLLTRVPWTETPIVCLEDWQDNTSTESVKLPQVKPNNVAYVIYTSGSTGRPKGVMVEHRGLSNLAAAQARAFGPKEGSRVLQFASYSFDASIFEIVMALTHGATLYVERQESLLPGPNFVKLLRDRHITLVTLPPSALAASPDADLPDLETITVAGEACPSDVVARWAEGRRFFNLYGPTETTIWTTAAECQAGTAKPPIGRPILNTQVYVLDERMEPTPIGVRGDLYIGGDSLARGYLNQPDLTAERFVPNPFSSDPGARLYRSGDVARHLSDGQIEFIGRADSQVKIRGFRIEPGEIEAALVEHEAVRESVVIAREDTPGEKRLVAYVVPHGEQPSVAELSSHLHERLPAYMWPTSYVFLNAIPLNPNGKIDRKALPAPAIYQPELEATYVPPQSELERAIAAIWQEALKIERVDVNDNFFSLGGHSILLAQVHTQLTQSLAPELSIVDLFKYPTINTLAKYLGDQEKPIADEGHKRAETRLDLLKRQAGRRGDRETG